MTRMAAPWGRAPQPADGFDQADSDLGAVVTGVERHVVQASRPESLVGFPSSAREDDEGRNADGERDRPWKRQRCCLTRAASEAHTEEPADLVWHHECQEYGNDQGDERSEQAVPERQRRGVVRHRPSRTSR